MYIICGVFQAKLIGFLFLVRGGGRGERERRQGWKREGEEERGGGKGGGGGGGGGWTTLSSEPSMRKLPQKYTCTLIIWFGYFGNHSG